MSNLVDVFSSLAEAAGTIADSSAMSLAGWIHWIVIGGRSKADAPETDIISDAGTKFHGTTQPVLKGARPRAIVALQLWGKP